VKLYITRHGETEWNVAKKLHGWQDSQLTASGIRNAELLGERLKNIHFDGIYSSPSKRTMKTEEIIRGERKTPEIMTDDRFREMGMGEWEGKTHDYLTEMFPVEYNHFFQAPHLFQNPGGESFIDFHERVKKAMDRINEEYDSGNILLVTHSVFIKSLTAHIKKLPLEKLWSPPYVYDTSLTLIEYNRGNYEIILESDISHRTEGLLNKN
jgi:probable phosphoglycerate mutase